MYLFFNKNNDSTMSNSLIHIKQFRDTLYNLQAEIKWAIDFHV